MKIKERKMMNGAFTTLALEDMISLAKDLCKNKRRAKDHLFCEEVHLEILKGTNEYNSSIYLIDKNGGVFGYFVNGKFWHVTRKTELTLID